MTTIQVRLNPSYNKSESVQSQIGLRYKCTD